MNRRQLLRLMALAGSASAVLPAPAIVNAPRPQPPGPGKAPQQPETVASMADAAAMKIGVVAAGSGACGILQRSLKRLPYLARSIAIDAHQPPLSHTNANPLIRLALPPEHAQRATAAHCGCSTTHAEIRHALAGLDLIWLLTSLGGTAGSAIGPAVAEVARQSGIPVIAISLTPFLFEGRHRQQIAQQGLSAIARNAAVSLALANDLFIADDSNETLDITLQRVNHILEQLYGNTSAVLYQDGLIGIDLADFRAVMARGQEGAFGIGESDRSVGEACVAALNHPALGAQRRCSAQGAFVALRLRSGSQAMSQIREAMQILGAAFTEPNACVIYGATVEPALPRAFSVSIIATT